MNPRGRPVLSRVVAALGSAAVVLVLLGTAALAGLVPLPGGSKTARPPCRDLPSSEEVAAALAAHPETTDALTAAVSGARVASASPCDGEYADRALIRITVPDDDGREQVEDWLGTHDGYGVPIEVETA